MPKRKPKPPALGIRDRIIELRRVVAGDLISHDKNWRTHPPAQLAALEGILGEVGIADALLGFPADGKGIVTADCPLMVFDGHARKDRDPSQVWPVLVMDLTRAEADKMLAVIDPLSAMAEPDEAARQALWDSLVLESQALKAMANTSPTTDSPVDEPEQKLPEFKGIWGIMTEVRLPSTNKWELPDLREDMLSDQIPEFVFDGRAVSDPTKTLYIHGTAKFLAERDAGGVLAFYVDDERFENIWNDPAHHVAAWTRFGWGSIVSADFSLWKTDPLAVQMWSMFRNRWLARYWQEARLKIIPSLCWSDERTHEWAFAGIPRGAPVVSIQCRTSNDKASRALFYKGMHAAVKQLSPSNVLLYGGMLHRDEIEKLLPEGPVYHYLDDWTSVRRKGQMMKSKTSDVRGNGGGGGGRPASPRAGGLVGA